ncbi:hypothetical protein EJ02DRAFT_419968 [Clathrospora elynae]|uniref:Uncharacterized protein n=1 Tax=Clathrospora elynae TaxID=706981 RepID=A0A6A5SW54_9PLEO|nr:hypothetical protein EJ02DRAFT_419968 [Clathrospora elynae]
MLTSVSSLQTEGIDFSAQLHGDTSSGANTITTASPPAKNKDDAGDETEPVEAHADAEVASKQDGPEEDLSGIDVVDDLTVQMKTEELRCIGYLGRARLCICLYMCYPNL